MVSHINSFAFLGVEVIDIDVQVHISSGLPTFAIVGLGDKAVAESKERIRTALNAIGLSLPAKRITVNLSPANLQKEGSHFDLPIAVGILTDMGVIEQDSLHDYIVMGELALDGKLTSISGVLPAAIGASSRDLGLICPHDNGKEALWAGEIEVLAPRDLLSIINHFSGKQILTPPQLNYDASITKIEYPDLKDIKGQESAKRALEVTAAGGHNMLMVGPPGSGKSMLAARLTSILPHLEPAEILETSMINSISGNLIGKEISSIRPFRAPHHNCSMPALIGGGTKAKPGEITLAHKGILFLDELPEFPRQVLDSLRQPLETREVTVARVQAHITYPADFQLIAAMNPCRCGHLDDADLACSKAPRCAGDYQSKLSGPLLDRIDIHIEVPAVKPMDMHLKSEQESSADVMKRVINARKIQKNRYKDKPKMQLNANAEGDFLVEICALDDAENELLKNAIDKMKLSMRGYNRVLRVARTIADLENSSDVKKHHLAESLSYRQINFKAPKS